MSKTNSEKGTNSSSTSTSHSHEEDDPLQKAFKNLNLGLDTGARKPRSAKVKVKGELKFDELTKKWKEKGFERIITMVGAGISTSAGIPDFRSPGSGLYHNLQKYNLPYPEAIFSISYFRANPEPFFQLAKELYPGSAKPTPTHYFIKLLHEKGWLLRHYTQNIDMLERVAEIPKKKLVEAHGTFYKNHCIKCKKYFSRKWMKKQIFDDVIPTCSKCNGIVKPDIIFFSEALPTKFYYLPLKDFRECDLLIIMGTSLEVQPFASLRNQANRKCIQILINREDIEIEDPNNKIHIKLLGDCDHAVQLIADAIGIGDELKEVIKIEHAKLDTAVKIEMEKSKISQSEGTESEESDESDEESYSDSDECDDATSSSSKKNAT